MWSALFGLIWLVITIEVFFTYLQGPTNSGHVPESVADAITWSAVLGPYFDALALPLTLPIAAVVGAGSAWFQTRRADQAEPGPVVAIPVSPST